MPLQIRRGTTAQRLSITPLVSELVYDITTKLVYVGDGVTAGGIAIDQDSSPDFPLGDLSDINLEDVAEGDILRYDGTDWVNSELSFSTLPGVNLNSPEVNQVLKFNGTSWTNENEDSSLIVSALDDLSNVEITDVANSQVLRWNGTAWENSNLLINDDGNIVDSLSNIILDVSSGSLIGELFGNHTGSVFANDFSIIVDAETKLITGNLVGDVRGSVFGDDSTVLVNGITGEINAPVGINFLNNITIRDDANEFLFSTPAEIPQSVIRLESTDEFSLIRLVRNSDDDLSLGETTNGAIYFTRNDLSGDQATGIILGRQSSMLLGVSTTGVYSNDTFFTAIKQSDSGIRFGIRTAFPDEALDVRGNATVSGFAKLGTFTSTERDAIPTPAVGMMIYNSTTNKFQGYQNSGGTTPEWVDLS
jgi:hypothetical protein